MTEDAYVPHAFRQGYIAAALFSSSDDEGEPLDSNYSEDDFSPSLVAAIDRDCARFWARHGETVESCAESHTPGSPDDTAEAHAGRDFWYTREGRGCGFWDGDWPEPAASELDKGAKRFSQADWYVRDDGMLYQMGAEHLG